MESNNCHICGEPLEGNVLVEQNGWYRCPHEHYREVHYHYNSVYTVNGIDYDIEEGACCDVAEVKIRLEKAIEQAKAEYELNSRS